MRVSALLIGLSAAVLAGCQTINETIGTPEPNPGPCPSALALYDAHRVVQINGEDIVYENVGFTGEVLNVASLCRYTDKRATPIAMELGVRMAFGRGPAARGEVHTYEMFVAITRRDSVVIHRETFPIQVEFRPGQDRVERIEEFPEISIPRANADTSGANFEVIVGFELTDDELEFNRSGLRFRVDAGSEVN